MTPALSNRQIARAALVLVFGFLSSGALGIIRTAIIAATFGTSETLDAFFAAQRIPETLFVLIAGGALGSSFLPIYSKLRAGEDPSAAWKLVSATLTLVTLSSIALAVVIGLCAPLLLPALLLPGAPPEMQALTVSLTQIMLATVAIFGVSGLLMALLNAHQQFLLPALAPSLYNAGLIVGALLLARLTPDGTPSVYGLAWGAVLGAALHLAVQLPGVRKVAPPLRFLLGFNAPGVRQVLLLMGPRVLGLAVVQINFAVNVAFTSYMVEGSYSALNTAWYLLFFALGVIAQSIGSAVFPSLAALAAQNDLAGFRQRLAGAMRSVLFLAFPAAAGLIVLGEPLIAVLFERGEWTAESTAATAWALAFFALGIAGHSLLEVLSRAFYALADTRTPVTVGLAAMVANIVLSFALIRVIGDPNSLSRGPFAGLALANSLTTLLEAAALWLLLRRRVGLADRYVLDGAGRALAAAGLMGLALLGLRALSAPYGVWVTAAAGIAGGAALFFGLALLLGVAEARTIPGVLLERLRARNRR
ncbi:MAG: murein biosynthesis integral membrane protein MurJ [Chloroflexi bacterium]|nr:murein biosynthesis integral membrane protein MurJ [Chloroflexota bacterium]